MGSVWASDDATADRRVRLELDHTAKGGQVAGFCKQCSVEMPMETAGVPCSSLWARFRTATFLSVFAESNPMCCLESTGGELSGPQIRSRISD